MREIIFDTETTGIQTADGHRIIEIGAIEMVDRIPTGRTFHEYINPEGKQVDPGAFDVHGIGNDQLVDKPTFKDLLPKFYEFFSHGMLIAHNASFDIGFFNAELDRLSEPAIDPERVIDTLKIARRKYPGAKNSLDALCGRLGISNAHRTLHGALLDSELLADVYIELTGGKQVGMALDVPAPDQFKHMSGENDGTAVRVSRQRPRPLASRLSEAEKTAHAALIEGMKTTPVWRKWDR